MVKLREARYVTNDILLTSGIYLFEGKAIAFYHDTRNKVQTWEELVKEFKIDLGETLKLLRDIENQTKLKQNVSQLAYLTMINRYFG